MSVFGSLSSLHQEKARRQSSCVTLLTRPDAACCHEFVSLSVTDLIWPPTSIPYPVVVDFPPLSSWPPPPLNLQPPYQTPPLRRSRSSALDDLAHVFSSTKKKLTKMGDYDQLIGSYSHLRHLPSEKYALETLRKIGSCVKPIMRKRGWRVGVLAEFQPEQSNLLGACFYVVICCFYQTNPCTRP
jgi:WLM domain-containing protein